MSDTVQRAIAVVGVGAILPEAPNAPAYWQNIKNKRYCISETPPERWNVADYYDPDPTAPDKTYSKIGGWVRGFQFDWKKYRIPPKVAAAMDEGQQWAVTIAAEALADYGYPERPLDTERTGVILGTAMGGEQHYITTMRIQFPEYRKALESVTEFSQLPPAVREAILAHWYERLDATIPPITEDTMPGELPNIVSGRVSNVLNLRGPSFITDAACASSFAAINAAVELLTAGQVDAVLTGGVDRNMGASIFVKFCKIGALSATGSRPFGDGADGFVMGEGSAAFLLKRLADAERDGDKIYAVIRGVGGSADGKGKGITAPNPIGQILAAQRAWANAGLDPATATLVEAHGTSTKVGDVVELESLTEVFGGAPRGSIALGSAKSNIGHLKAGAGAAGLLKAVMAIHEKVLPPTLNAEKPNPNADFNHSPFFLSHNLQAWESSNGAPRRAGVSSYGFGGTNFHVVLEEYVPGMLARESTLYSGVAVAGSQGAGTRSQPAETPAHSRSHWVPAQAGPAASAKQPVRGILAIGAADPVELKNKLDEAWTAVEGGWVPPIAPPGQAELGQRERLVIDFGDHGELLDKLAKARKAAGFDNPQAWKALSAMGIFRGSGAPAGKIAFLFPGQGSQYSNMGRELAQLQPVVAETFREADAVMTPILGRPLTSYIFVDGNDPAAMKQAERDLMQTAITQPAMLTMDTAFYKLLGEYGFKPDMVMGHSLGEYGALIAAGIMPFAHALEASAARGAEMTKVSWDDNGWMAAVMAPYDVIMQTLAEIDGYVVAANINSYNQCVVGGASKAVEQAIERFTAKGYQAMRIPVSHAFHTKIVAPASKPLRKVLDRLSISEPQLPLVANVTGELYPTTVEGIKDILELQIASPVQWVKGLETMYREGCRTFVEVGPKKALKGFVDDVLGSKPDVVSLFTNHPKTGELPSFNQALCGLYAAGYGARAEQPVEVAGSTLQVAGGSTVAAPVARVVPNLLTEPAQPAAPTHLPAAAASQSTPAPPKEPTMSQPSLPADALGQLAQVLQQALSNLQPATSHLQPATSHLQPADRNAPPLGSVVISGTGLGLPGPNKPLMDPDNALRILRGEQFIDLIPERFRQRMLDKRITRLVKSEDGTGSFQVITDPAEVLKLAGRAGEFDLAEEYGVPAKLVEALDITTQYCFAAGLDALREAGIPLVQTWRKTTTGKFLPDRWMLPEALRDETGVVFASAFPGGDRFAEEFTRYYQWENRRMQLAMLEDLRSYTGDMQTLQELSRRIGDLREQMEREPYTFDRRFIFRILSMGHSQFAEYIGARGPNAHCNAACASTAQGVALAEDWIRSGRCRRVLVLGGDDVTSDHLMEWVGAGFLALGASATDDRVDEAALPFDRRRHGTILGMGACGLVVESEDAVRERGMRGIVELLSSETMNSAYHGSRLDVNHISQVMENLVAAAERRFGVNRYAMASQTVFMSHETFTPARGGSASAEVIALRNTFGEAASDIVVANTKGFTGHPMGVGVEDVIAVKILEYGIVPPVPNFKEVDPDLGVLNLSRGGRYPVLYALHLAAGFGSQISLTLTRRIPGGLDRIDDKLRYQHWLDGASGYDRAELEVVKRNLRVKSLDGPGRAPAPSPWRYGLGPSVRAAAPGDGSAAAAYHPQPMPAVRELLGKPAAAPIAPAPETPRPAAPPPAPVAAKPEPVAAPAAPVAAPAPVVTVPAPAPAPAVPQGPSVPPAPAGPDAVASQVLGIVAEKTGYPQDMLDLDLDLEADLGIDTVKQAETFQAVREAFAIPQQEGLSLRDYPTLESVIGFVHKMRPDLQRGTQGSSEELGGTQATPVPPVPPVPLAPPVPSADAVSSTVLEIVADKTGYPKDMLDLDLDLEADLGIDTVKQAETFQAVREAFAIPQQEGLSLRDYPTLESVIGFVHKMRPDLQRGTQGSSEELGGTQATPVPPVPPVPLAPPVPSADAVSSTVLAIVAAKTGYPEDMLELDLDLEADLGIDTVKQAETFQAIREAYDIPFQENLALRDYPTLQSVIGFVYTMRPDLQRGTQGSSEELGGTQATPVPPVPPVPLAPPVPSADAVSSTVLAIVAAKTGYPEDMLELDLDLEADLGIDTVKQAETFQAIREAYDIPFQENLALRDYPTLQSVIGFVYTMRPDLQRGTQGSSEELGGTQATPVPPAPPVPPVPPVPSVSTIGTLEDADKMPRRVPVPSLRPAIDLCKPTGVTLGSGSRVVVMLDRGGVGKSLVNRLEKLGATALTLEPGVATEALEAQLKGWLAEGPIQGVYWLPALDVEAAIEEMTLDEWREANRARVKNLYTAMRALYDSVAGPNTFLVSATRLGGLHGYGEAGATAPLGGAVSGFTKAYNMEQALRPEDAGKGVVVKVVDFEASRKTAEPADALIAETLYDPGIVEVGYHNGLRYTVTLVEKPARDGQPGMVLDKNTVFVVTGAAGGITSAITTDLAVHSGGVFYLLDLVACPPRDDAYIRLFREGRETLKQALIAEAKASGEKVTPKQIDDKMMGIERGEAALRAVESVEAAGGVAHYFSLDLRDGDKVAAVVEDIRARYGKIDVLLHAGGLLIDRTLPNKEPHQFALVFDVKADGFFSLLQAAKGMPIGATVSFSSVAGRFGNNGQSDYSSANDLLCKISSAMRAWRPETRGIAIDWTAWGQIGMASRGSVPAIMAALGIDMLPAEAGVPTIRRELTYGGTRGEIVVAGRLGAWMEERDPTGGADVDKINAALAQRQPRLLMVGEVKAAKLYGGLEVETLLHPSEQPFLFDHAPDAGTPWLPGVMATEALAELATVLTGLGQETGPSKGWRVAAVENEQMMGAFKFFRMEPRSLYLSATITPAGTPAGSGGQDLLAHAVLRSVTKPAKEGLPVQVKEHFAADVRLTAAPAEKPALEFQPPADADLPITAAEIYQTFFHGPAYQVIERAGVQGGRCVALMPHNLPPNTAPADVESLLAPRLVELCFQAAALWHVKTHNAMAFPLGFASVAAYRQPEEAEGRRLYGVVQTNDNGDTFDGQVLDEAGNLFMALKGYRTVGRPG